MVFYEAQASVARALVAGPKTLEQLRQETKLSALEVNEALRGLVRLRLVERAGNDYQLVSYITEKVKRIKAERLKKLEEAGPFKASFVIEAAGESAAAVQKQLSLLEEKLRKEPFKLLRLEKSSVEKLEAQYSQFLDFDVQTPSFSDLLSIVITYGPSSAELLEPREVRLSLSEAQDVLVSVINAVHYYTGFILQSQLKLAELGAQPGGKAGSQASSAAGGEAGSEVGEG